MNDLKVRHFPCAQILSCSPHSCQLFNPVQLRPSNSYISTTHLLVPDSAAFPNSQRGCFAKPFAENRSCPRPKNIIRWKFASGPSWHWVERSNSCSNGSFRTLRRTLETGEVRYSSLGIRIKYLHLYPLNRYPVLLAVDDFQALYNHTSSYRNPRFEGIKTYHLSIPRLLLEFASGKKSFVSNPSDCPNRSLIFLPLASRCHLWCSFYSKYWVPTAIGTPRSPWTPLWSPNRTVCEETVTLGRIRTWPAEFSCPSAPQHKRGCLLVWGLDAG